MKIIIRILEILFYITAGLWVIFLAFDLEYGIINKLSFTLPLFIFYTVPIIMKAVIRVKENKRKKIPINPKLNGG